MEAQTQKENEGIQDRVVAINRVAKVVKGGRRFSFSALVVAGDGKEKVGFGIGKADEVPDAIKKASEQARKNMVKVYHHEGTLPFDVDGSFASAQVRMYPAKSGKGLIAGGAVRTIVELGGFKDVVCKIHGSKNSHNVVRATFNGLSQLTSAQDYAARRGLDVADCVQKRHSEEKTAKV